MNIESTSCDQRGIVIVFGRKSPVFKQVTVHIATSYELRTTNYELCVLTVLKICVCLLLQYLLQSCSRKCKWFSAPPVCVYYCRT